MFEYFDIHSHLYFKDFDTDREAEITKMKETNIGAITVGVNLQTSEEAIALAEKHENLFATVGFHPGDVTADTVFDTRLEELASRISPKRSEGNKSYKASATIVAIGECGLDYFRPTDDFEKIKQNQKKIFQNHIDLALKLDLPLMLHIRPAKGSMDAYFDALEILEKEKQSAGEKLRGNVHFFVGDLQVLKRFLAIGFTVSFTGVITFTHDYDEIVRATPLNMLMSETDTPFVAPVPHRGQRNSPMYVAEVVKKIAELRGEDLETVRAQIVANATRVFGI